MAPPVLLVHLYTKDALKHILGCIDEHHRAETEIYLGTFSIDKDHAEAIKALHAAGARYAPTFHLAPLDNEEVRAGRHLSAANVAKLDPDTAQFAGPFPADPSIPWLPAKMPRLWGIELGRRFRDQLRAKKRLPIDGWQLDEIDRKCGLNNSTGTRYRQFVGGVLRGIAEGRATLGDEYRPGFIWIAWDALTGLRPMMKKPKQQPADEVTQFWADVNRGAKFLVGEEYPPFDVGREEAEAVTRSGPHTALAKSANSDCTALAERYIVGMSPGWRLRTKQGKPSGLGGNTANLSIAKVTAWREEFIVRRTNRQQPAGYGQFFFEFENAQPDRIDNAITSLYVAADQHSPPL